MQITAGNVTQLLRGLSYPFWRPQGSFVFVSGRVVMIEQLVLGDLGASRINDAGLVETLRQAVDRFGLEPGILSAPRHAILAHGSNASPVQLAYKSAEAADAFAFVPVLAVDLKHYTPVFSAQFSPYGATPATLTPTPGATSRAHVTMLTDAQLATMNMSEGLGDRYNLLAPPHAEVRVRDGGDAISAEAYIAASGALVANGTRWALPTVGADAPLPRSDQRRVMRMVCDLLGFRGDIEEFILMQLHDPDLSMARERVLREHHCRPFGPSVKDAFGD